MFCNHRKVECTVIWQNTHFDERQIPRTDVVIELMCLESWRPENEDLTIWALILFEILGTGAMASFSSVFSSVEG